MLLNFAKDTTNGVVCIKSACVGRGSALINVNIGIFDSWGKLAFKIFHFEFNEKKIKKLLLLYFKFL